MAYGISFHKRHGFVFTIPLMLGIGMIMFGAVIAISQTFVEVGGPLAPELLSEMPTFFDYSSDTEMADTHDGSPNERLQLYYLLVLVATIMLIILGMVAGIAWFAEDFNLMQPGTAFKIITKVIVFLPFFMIFPYVWDLYAVSIENTSLFLMDPFDSSDPSTRSQTLWQGMGSVLPPDAFDVSAWGAALADPGTAGQALLKNVFLALFRGIAVMMMTAMMFVLSAVRLVLTSVLIIALPLILVLSLVPFFKKATTLLTDNLIGLSIAPIFSAMVLTAGLAYLDSTNLPAMQDWFSTLAVGFLAVFFPIFLSPMLGQMATHVGQAMQTAMQSAAIISGTGIQGMAQGMASASSAMEGAGVNVMGHAAGAGIGAIAGNSVSSLGLGQATSGMGGFEKFKTLAKGALTGAAAGTAAGAIHSAGSIAGNPEMSRYTARSVMSAGQTKAFEIGQMGMANSVVRNVNHNMISMETLVNPEIVSSSFGSSCVSALMVSNPGGMIHSMETPSLLNLPQTQQELLAHQQQSIDGFDHMSPKVQEQITVKLAEQIKQHPQSASRMLNDVKSGSSGKNTDIF
ncbi:hypothetical protein [Nitrosopumilus ureiphilus]|uniref:hypothetical protein n=1 Tax=Nitrosopumilus ureiphilus TaxID=1470067 RepID=UPI0015CB4A53|nr:hypothetical protein [Nitrosopumilus ureiphilus]